MQSESTNNQQQRRKSSRLYLKNLPDNYTVEDVTSFLKPFGKYTNMELQTGTDKPLVVELHYETPEDATAAAAKLANEVVDGKSLKVEFIGNRNNGNKARQDGRQNMTHLGLQSARGPNNNDFPLRILVPTEVVGAIIGRKGETIKQITQTSHARIDIHGRENSGQTPEKAITIFGTPENCTAACKEIMKIIEQEMKNENPRFDIYSILLTNF